MRADESSAHWLWRVLRWPLVGLTAVASFVLGRIGFDIALSGQGAEFSNADLTYLSFQLFTLESGSYVLGELPWQLHVARVVAPLTTATALAAGLAAVFRYELEEFRLRRQKGHVVVAGLGRRGSVLAKKLRMAGHRVVGIDRDIDEARIAGLRRLQIPVIQGDARQSETLRRARIDRAAHLIAVTDADDANADIALRAGAEGSNGRSRPLMCHAHIRDPELCVLLREEELAGGAHPEFRLDFFNVYDQAVRAWQSERSPIPDRGTPNVVVAGLNALGQSVVVETARRWRAVAQPGQRMHITALDRDAEELVAQLRRSYPQLEHVAEIEPVDVKVSGLVPGDVPVEPPPTAVYVCLDDDSTSLQTALQIRHALDARSVPVVAQLTDSLGLAGLLERSGTHEILPLYLFDVAMSPEVLLGGSYEVLARQIHSRYVDEHLADGDTVAGNPSMMDWADLPATLRESNRDQAAHIGTKLAAIGCDIAPLADWGAESFEFSGAELEMLAELEHERWVDQRTREGWTLGEKDLSRNRSPHLVPWRQLDDETREWDRRAVRHIPKLLASAGYQIVRRPDRPGSARIPARRT